VLDMAYLEVEHLRHFEGWGCEGTLGTFCMRGERLGAFA
jgi:hypothetical protein